MKVKRRGKWKAEKRRVLREDRRDCLKLKNGGRGEKGRDFSSTTGANRADRLH